MRTVQDLKCWILLGCEADETTWQLVQDLTTGPCRELIEDDNIAKWTSFVYWDKRIADAALRKLKQYAKEHETGCRYCVAELSGQARSPYKARKKD